MSLKINSKSFYFETAGVKQESGHLGSRNPSSVTGPHGKPHLAFSQYTYATDQYQYTGVPALFSSLDNSAAHLHGANLDGSPDSQHWEVLGGHHNNGRVCVNKVGKVSSQPAFKPNVHQSGHQPNLSSLSLEPKSLSSHPSCTSNKSSGNACLQQQSSGYHYPSPGSRHAAVCSPGHLKDAVSYSLPALSQDPPASHQPASQSTMPHGDPHQLLKAQCAQAVSNSTSPWASASTLDASLVTQPSFHSQGELFHIKQEPEDRDGNLQSAGLHFTLDDGKLGLLGALNAENLCL